VLTAPTDAGLSTPEVVADGGSQDECDRPEPVDTQELLTPQPLLKGRPDDCLGEKSFPGSERSASPFQPAVMETPQGDPPRDLATLRRSCIDCDLSMRLHVVWVTGPGLRKLRERLSN